ncbi:hypothetical protein LCGC14_3028330 [marine sediment metagenome]|uniref:Uncharacterized protein n=1 Tax=marine sediment metagenome TaxID=412755 RepID=A0A0F8ZJA3_9ZZZZ
MVKQIPSNRTLGSGSGEMGQETNVDYLRRHAEEWEPPLGKGHLHLISKMDVHWRVVDRGSSVCSEPGRCHLITIRRRSQ